MEHDPELRTPEEIHAYIKEDTAKQNAAWQEKCDHILRAKNAIWLLLLVVVVLQVYMIDVMIEATSLNARSLLNTASVKLIGCQRPLTQL